MSSCRHLLQYQYCHFNASVTLRVLDTRFTKFIYQIILRTYLLALGSWHVRNTLNYVVPDSSSKPYEHTDRRWVLGTWNKLWPTSYRVYHRNLRTNWYALGAHHIISFDVQCIEFIIEPYEHTDKRWVLGSIDKLIFRKIITNEI